MIASKEPVRQLKAIASQRGLRRLTEAALELVRVGATTVDEVRRVTMAG
jgi:general secretion pathway protein E